MFCYNGLNVQIEGTIPASFKLKAVGAGDPPVIVESTESALVESNIYLEVFTPEQVTIQTSFDSDSISETFYPVFYEAYQPNGPTCGPTCLEATVTVVL